MKDRYSVAVAVIFVALVAFVTVQTLGGDGEGGTLGLDSREARWPLPEFAVPAVASALEGDANVAQDDCALAAVPCPEEARRDPACQVDAAGAIRVCDYFDLPLVISFWFAGEQCVAQQDVVEAVSRRYRDRVNFLSIDIRDDRDEVREIVRERGWTMPVGHDRDGAVGGLYGVGGCPTFAYVYPGGTLQSASIGELTEPELAARVERLLGAARAAQEG